MLYLDDKPVVSLRGKTGLVIFNALTGGAQYQRSGQFFFMKDRNKATSLWIKTIKANVQKGSSNG